MGLIGLYVVAPSVVAEEAVSVGGRSVVSVVVVSTAPQPPLPLRGVVRVLPVVTFV